MPPVIAAAIPILRKLRRFRDKTQTSLLTSLLGAIFMGIDAGVANSCLSDDPHPCHVVVHLFVGALEEQNIAAPAIGPETCAALPFPH